jgi:hypothetical protein
VIRFDDPSHVLLALKVHFREQECLKAPTQCNWQVTRGHPPLISVQVVMSSKMVGMTIFLSSGIFGWLRDAYGSSVIDR